MIRLPPRSTRTDTLFPYTTLFRSLLAACTRRCSGYHRCKAGPSAREDQRAPRRFGQAGIISRPSGADRADEDNWEGLAHLFYVRKSRTYLVSCKRSEERRVGKECVSTCSYWWSPDH